MESILKPLIWGVASGLLTYAVGFLALPWVIPGKIYPIWAHMLSELIDSISLVLPGFIGGFLAKQHGFVVGGIVGALVVLIISTGSAIVTWSAVVSNPDTISSFYVGTAAALISSVVTNSFSGLGGASVGQAKSL